MQIVVRETKAPLKSPTWMPGPRELEAQDRQSENLLKAQGIPLTLWLDAQ